MTTYTQPDKSSTSYSNPDKPVSRSYLLQQNGDYLLKQDGDQIIIGTDVVGSVYDNPSKNTPTYTSPTKN